MPKDEYERIIVFQNGCKILYTKANNRWRPRLETQIILTKHSFITCVFVAKKICYHANIMAINKCKKLDHRPHQNTQFFTNIHKLGDTDDRIIQVCRQTPSYFCTYCKLWSYGIVSNFPMLDLNTVVVRNKHDTK